MNHLSSIIIFHIFVLAAFVIDWRHRRSHSFASAVSWSVFWIAVGLIFALYVGVSRGGADATAYLAAYVLEKSLSLDNVFVFWLIFQRWSIPPNGQHRVLMWGIGGALIMRAVMITVGVKAVQAWHGILVLFGLFLLAMGLYTIATDHKPRDSVQKIRINQAKISTNTKKFWHDGKPTVLLGALLCVEWSDVIFAIDSVPAIFALTQDPFIVYTSNIMAILGLRSLYGVLQHAAGHVRYLSYGIGVILAVVGLKMLGIVVLTAPQAVVLMLVVISISLAASINKPLKPGC